MQEEHNFSNTSCVWFLLIHPYTFRYSLESELDSYCSIGVVLTQAIFWPGSIHLAHIKVMWSFNRFFDSSVPCKHSNLVCVQLMRWDVVWLSLAAFPVRCEHREWVGMYIWAHSLTYRIVTSSQFPERTCTRPESEKTGHGSSVLFEEKFSITSLCFIEDWMRELIVLVEIVTDHVSIHWFIMGRRSNASSLDKIVVIICKLSHLVSRRQKNENVARSFSGVKGSDIPQSILCVVEIRQNPKNF